MSSFSYRFFSVKRTIIIVPLLLVPASLISSASLLKGFFGPKKPLSALKSIVLPFFPASAS